MKAQDLKNFNLPPNIIIVGAAGSGKTALASQLGSGCYCFDFDNGMRTCLTLQDAFTPFRQSIEFDIFADDDLTAPKGFVKAKQKLSDLFKKPPRGVVLDSLTGLAQAVKFYVMNTTKNNPFAQPEIQHWGAMINEVEQFILKLRALKCPTIMTAHLGADEDSAGVRHQIISSITKNHGRSKLSWLFDEVLYMTVRPKGQGKYGYVVSGRSVELPTRTRSGILSDTDITETGLAGLLSRVGFDFTPEADVETQNKGL